MNELIEGARLNTDNVEWLPAGQFPNAPDSAYKSKVMFSIDTSQKMIRFTMQNDGGIPSAHGNENDGDFLYILSGDYIELTIELSTDWKWKFDRDPLSFKTKSDAKYYQLASWTPHSITIWAKSTDDEYHNPSSERAKTHGFNLYIRMDQTSRKKFPVRLDPDLKNPPPPLLAQTTTQPVPIV